MKPIIAAALWLFASSALSATRPNILFIAVDDLRPELGCYGNAIIKTPNIDRLAAEGVCFTRAYCQQAVCNPSRVSIMTGLRPDSAQVWDLVTDFRDTVPDVVTLPQQFMNHGYTALSYGKIYHNPMPDHPSWSEPHRWPEKSSLWSDDAKKRLTAFREQMRAEGKSETAIQRMRAPATEIVDVPDEQHIDGAIATQAIDAMRRLARENNPFFLATGFIRPHLPFVVPRKYWDLYDREKIPMAENADPPAGAPPFAMNTMYELRDYMDFANTPPPDQGSLTIAQRRELKHGYYASVSFIDTLVGKLLDELESLGRADDTIVVLWSDHGWKLGEHGSWCKQTNYEIDTRLPLIIRDPRAKANGRKTTALAELVDVYPTLCELAGLPLPDHLEGTSLAPLLQNPDHPWSDAAFSQFPRKHAGVETMGYAVRTDRYRLVEWRNRATAEVTATELYDHASDPDENANIAARPGNSELIATLAGKLREAFPRSTVPYRKPAPAPNTLQPEVEQKPAPEKDAAAAKSGSRTDPTGRFTITDPPGDLALDPFYRKCLFVGTYPILGSEKVSDFALFEAAHLVSQMLARRPDVLKALGENHSRLVVMAHDEFTTSVPEHAEKFASSDESRKWWDRRARGLGGSATDPVASCAEENLLCFPGDPYAKENILIHEFAHTIHLRGMNWIDPAFDGRVKEAYEKAVGAGLWKEAYAGTNYHEYFAEGVQCWFDNNRENDDEHNHVNTRRELVEYDAGLANLCREVFGDTELVYVRPPDRKDQAHLAGYDYTTSPTFEWPAELAAAGDDIKRTVQERNQNARLGTRPKENAAGESPANSKRDILGWTVHINNALLTGESEASARALEILHIQLERVVDAIPAAALERLRAVPLWINPPPPGARPTAAYHPDPGWLREHDRDPSMAKGIEFTNVAIMPFENRRMPSMALHELAHAYHDQVLGFDHPEIEAAYQAARKSGRYESVKRWTGNEEVVEKAYAMDNHKEYFAETTEAFFGKNDFYPFTREELNKHDPGMYRLLEKVWGTD